MGGVESQCYVTDPEAMAKALYTMLRQFEKPIRWKKDEI
jgi:hypothetical protein